MLAWGLVVSLALLGSLAFRSPGARKGEPASDEGHGSDRLGQGAEPTDDDPSTNGVGLGSAGDEPSGGIDSFCLDTQAQCDVCRLPETKWGIFRGYVYRWDENKGRWVVAAGAVIVGSQGGAECSEPPGGDQSGLDGYYELDVDDCSLPGNVTLAADYLGQYAAIDVVYHPGNTQVWHDFYMLPY